MTVPLGCTAIVQLSTRNPLSVYRLSTGSSQTERYRAKLNSTARSQDADQTNVVNHCVAHVAGPADFLNRVRKFDSCRGHPE